MMPSERQVNKGKEIQMSRLRIQEVLIVEGKYDAATLATQVDGLIITTGGFSIFTEPEKIELLRKLGKERGLIILTDSDAAGFQIRTYIEKKVKGCDIKHAYIPAVKGKESRKNAPSKEGTLGVEGLPPEVLRNALLTAGANSQKERVGREITYTDLYIAGLSGGVKSVQKRKELLARIGLPHRLSKRALCQVLNSLYSYEEFLGILQEKPVLFWDFHGTLTLPEITWFTVAMEAASEQVPEVILKEETLVYYFSKTCLPWFTEPSGDTRHLAGRKAWWTHCEGEFVKMFIQCGFSRKQAEKIAPQIRGKILEPSRYPLYSEAIETLQTLQKRGYKSYILSNNFPELEEIIKKIGLRSYFQKIFVSGRIGYDKPHQEIFAKAKKYAGSPSNCWMIGDNLKDDVQGANEAGFTTVLANASAKSELADYTVQNLVQLLEILQ